MQISFFTKIFKLFLVNFFSQYTIKHPPSKTLGEALSRAKKLLKSAFGLLQLPLQANKVQRLTKTVQMILLKVS